MKILKEVLLIVTSLFTLNSFSQEIDNDLDSTIYLNEIIVNAFQISTLQLHVPGSVSVLTGEEIQITDGNNFAHTLHSIPGIYMHSGTYSTSRVIIRGVGSRTPYNTNRIKSYLNDIPITSSDGISTPEDIDLMGIGRMEVIKGPASATYGSGLGGNIILYTPRSTKEGAAALIQYGSFNTIKAAASGNYINQNLNLWGTISHVNSDGYRENNRYRRTSFISSGEWEQKDYSLEYTLMLIDLNAQIPSSVGKSLYESNPKAAAANWSAIEGYKKYQRAIAGVTLTNLFSDKWTNKLNVFGRWADSYERRPFNNLDDGTSGGGISNRLSYHNNQWDAMIGFEWVKDVYRWKMDLKNEMINKNRESRDHYNLFSMIYWRPASEWNISLGGAVNKVNYLLRDQFLSNGDQSGERSFPLIFSPRLGINYAPSQLLAFYGSVGHGFSMPSPEETLLPEGDINKELKPEQGVQYEMGFRLNLFRRATTIEASVYYINLNNLLVTKRLSEDIFTGINAGKTSHNGFEFLIKQKILRLSSFPGIIIMR
jgi:iron complex outermembrane receptor protein